MIGTMRQSEMIYSLLDRATSVPRTDIVDAVNTVARQTSVAARGWLSRVVIDVHQVL